MPQSNFSMSNPSIGAYFTKAGSEYVPVSELLYLHTHPLVKPNFLNEIEETIRKTAVAVKDKKVSGIPAEKLGQYAIEIAADITTLDSTSAPKMLSLLREVYLYCNNLLKSIT